MITNREIAGRFKLLGDLTVLLGENAFRARSYASAYQRIRNHSSDLAQLSRENLLEIPGIGKNIADKIIEYLDTGDMSAIRKRLDQFPDSFVELFEIKGLGPKKIKVLWEELEIVSLEELKYACEENRLIVLKGFGVKTQQAVLEKVDYKLLSRNKKLYAQVYPIINSIINAFNSCFQGRIELVGEGRRRSNILSSLSFIFTNADFNSNKNWLESVERITILEDGNYYLDGSMLVDFYKIDEPKFEHEIVVRSISPSVISSWKETISKNTSEQQLFNSLGFKQAYPELYDLDYSEVTKLALRTNRLINVEDVKGLIHFHTNYSDGGNTLAEMRVKAMSLGLEYMLVTDHSQSAFYANGLKEEKVYRQHVEIDSLNKDNVSFKIFKGIESDILIDGSLDYPDDVLESFDLVIASVHSVLNMDKEKATIRILNAIKNPYTDILGHLSGRLLLSRKGYELDYDIILEACAEYNVAIELNSNPYRLDIDWRYIPRCVELGIMLYINPDAHKLEGVEDIKYGIYSARKGGLTASNCTNTWGLKKFEDYIFERKQQRLNIINNF